MWAAFYNGGKPDRKHCCPSWFVGPKKGGGAVSGLFLWRVSLVEQLEKNTGNGKRKGTKK